MTIDEMIDAVKKIKVKKFAREAMAKHLPVVEEMNRQQPMRGEDANGDGFLSYAWDDYAEMKERRNPVPGFGRPDLRLTGAFHRSIKAKLDASTAILITASDKKAPWLEDHYKPAEIYGLQPENLDLLAEKVHADFFDRVTAASGL